MKKTLVIFFVFLMVSNLTFASVPLYDYKTSMPVYKIESFKTKINELRLIEAEMTELNMKSLLETIDKYNLPTSRNDRLLYENLRDTTVFKTKKSNEISQLTSNLVINSSFHAAQDLYIAVYASQMELEINKVLMDTANADYEVGKIKSTQGGMTNSELKELELNHRLSVNIYNVAKNKYENLYEQLSLLLGKEVEIKSNILRSNDYASLSYFKGLVNNRIELKSLAISNEMIALDLENYKDPKFVDEKNIQLSVEKMERQIDLNSLKIEAEKIKILSEVEKGYFDLTILWNDINLKRLNLAYQEETYNNMVDLYNQGFITKSALNQSIIPLKTAEMQYQIALMQYSNARDKLISATSVGPAYQ